MIKEQLSPKDSFKSKNTILGYY